MDFIDQLRVLSTRIANTKNRISTEEATKNAMIMPFIQILGYNVFDPMEVTLNSFRTLAPKREKRLTMRFFAMENPSSCSNVRKLVQTSTLTMPASCFGIFTSQMHGLEF